MNRQNLFRYLMQTSKLVFVVSLFVLGAQFVVFSPASVAAQGKPSHLRLVDRLDRPKDGYCLDIPGAPPNLFPQFPLFAHNCMPSLKADTTVIFTADGYIRFPAVDMCVTFAGVKTSLPGASVMLGKCNPSNPFIDISKRQRFTHRPDGTLALRGTRLCLSVGTQSAPTLSPVHRWRTLFVVDCAKADPKRARWEFVIPRS